MKKLFLILALMVLPVAFAAAQQRKIEKANEQTAAWRYDIQNEAVGSENTALVLVWSYSKKVDIAQRQATKNAIHGLIFRGAAANSDPTKRTKALAPLVASPMVEQQYAAFFEKFFADNGEYARYAAVTSAGKAGTVMKVGKEYKVGVYVTVQYSDLRKRLEDEGIIKRLTEVAMGKKPSIMVVPSDVWCIQQGYYTEVDNQGQTERVPDYARALQSDPNLLLVISKIGELMAERGYPLSDLEAALKSIREEETDMMVLTSKDTGSELAETPMEQLNRVAKADIWMQMTWSENHMGPRVSVSFNLQGKDAYTGKQIAASSGTCPAIFASMLDLPVYLAENVGANIEPFNNQLMAFFDDMSQNGREVRLTCRCWDDAGYDFESDFDGEELGFLIEDVVAETTANNKYTLDASQNKLNFTQVRIPLVDERGRDLDARRWANKIKRMLKEKYNLESKLISKGLGHAILILGGK